MSRLPLLLPVVVLCACSRLAAVMETPEATLADLEPVAVPAEQRELPQVGLNELADIYRGALAQQQDPETRLLVLHRLADIEMLGGEAELASSDVDTGFFADAINAYEALLQDNPGYPLNDRVLYQLSSAYDLSGEADKSLAVLERLSQTYPQSVHVPEAQFRRAERYFVDGNYTPAEAAYSRVVAAGPDTPYYTRALYMQGWSRFKQDRYLSSITSFTLTLDQLVPADNQLQELARPQRELVQDCLRVLAIVFSNLNGTQTIASAYEELGVRSYQHSLYEALGDLYLSQQRYRDSAQAYMTFSQRYPQSRVAHMFQMRVIQAYEAGAFPELIISAKQDYVSAFGVSGAYWQNSELAVQQLISARLLDFIGELASYYHALAQATARGKEQNKETLAADYYASAASYYQLSIESFPGDPGVPEMGFMLAESRFEAGNYSDAITAYEWVAYEFTDYDKASDAAYAAILAYDRLADLAGDDLARARVDSELRFSSTFHEDPRAPQVQGHAASELLRLGDYSQAISAASQLTTWQPEPATQLLVPAWLVVGHSQFELQQFPDAQAAYREALALMEEPDERRTATLERFAAAIYRQAEESVASGDDLEAARRFHLVIAQAPQSQVRINAQFDAATAYMRADELEQANALLIDFRERYPNHELTASIGSSLVSNYELLGDWRQAARELDAIHTTQPEGELRRQALIVSAQYYDKAGERELAAKRYRSYAQAWPQPFDTHMEAVNRLCEIYEEAGEADKQRFWLEKIMLAHDSAGAGQTERSRYLAAHAASVLADDAYQQFNSITLQQPLNKSLRRKKQAMELTLEAYATSNSYGIEEYSTLASYRMGKVYQQLSSDLMSSERPGGLDALALEQYEVMLAEQTYPFEEKALSIHESNVRRCWNGVYDQWVKQSFAELARLHPARYAKQEQITPITAETGKHLLRSSRRGELEEYNEKGIALRQAGDFSGAEKAYLQALDAWEAGAATHRNIGILYDLYLGEQDRALRHFHRYQELTQEEDRTVAGWIVDLERRQVTLVRGAM